MARHDPENPSGPLGPPSSTTWRRQRLLHIGSNSTMPGSSVDFNTSERTPTRRLTETARPTESTSLQREDSVQSYGTLPKRRPKLFDKPPLTFPLPYNPNSDLSTSFHTNPPSPSSFKDFAYSRLHGQRPISAYDAPLGSRDGTDTDLDAKINGIRVWYTSFSSIDWLHDAIKDSVRFSRLRKRKSNRARIRLVFDKSLGWIIVTIVGFLTAVVAFLIIRSEQWLFDLKEGYCGSRWYYAKRFCCPLVDGGEMRHIAKSFEDMCPAWITWSQNFFWKRGGYQEEIFDYILYTCIAVRAPTHF